MYTSGRSVKSRSKKVNPITKATRETRAIVDKVMPGAGVTVDSRLSFDLATDTPTVITTITFPRSDLAAQLLSVNLLKLGGEQAVADSSITVTRAVA